MFRYSSILRQLQTPARSTLRLGSPDEWCNPGLYPEIFNQYGYIRPTYYREMARHYPFLNFYSIPLQNQFGLPATPVLQKIILSETRLSSLSDFEVLKECPALTLMDMSCNYFGNTHSLVILGKICQARKNTLEELDLDSVNLFCAEKDSVERLIVEGSVLQSLCLNSCHIRDDQAASLALNLRGKKPPLRSFFMTDNPDVTAIRLLHILESLTGSPVQHIDFRDCRPFLPRHHDAVMQAINGMPGLKRFDLPGNTPREIAKDVQALLKARAEPVIADDNEPEGSRIMLR